MIIRVSKSPYPVDLAELPWDYSIAAFKDWVWEVFLCMGKYGKYPRNRWEAIQVAEACGYEVEIKYQ